VIVLCPICGADDAVGSTVTVFCSRGHREQQMEPTAQTQRRVSENVAGALRALDNNEVERAKLLLRR
jgi:hypothetical protein